MQQGGYRWADKGNVRRAVVCILEVIVDYVFIIMSMSIELGCDSVLKPYYGKIIFIGHLYQRKV